MMIRAMQCLFVAGVLYPSIALAQSEPSAPSVNAAPPPSGPLPVLTAPTPAAVPPVSAESNLAEGAPLGPPPAHVGFQLGIRTGFALPFGNVDGGSGDTMNNFFSGQVPFLFDVGGKPLPWLFLGGYLGVGVGGTAGTLDSVCSTPGVTCATATVRVGIEAIAYINAGEKVSPWVGYGIGFESSAIGISAPNGDSSVAASGPEFARFMGGVDFRLTKGFGIGPFVDFSIGEYTHLQTDTPNTTASGSLESKSVHEWLALGVRGVLFP
jgi:hypothetical protein